MIRLPIPFSSPSTMATSTGSNLKAQPTTPSLPTSSRCSFLADLSVRRARSPDPPRLRSPRRSRRPNRRQSPLLPCRNLCWSSLQALLGHRVSRWLRSSPSFWCMSSVVRITPTTIRRAPSAMPSSANATAAMGQILAHKTASKSSCMTLLPDKQKRYIAGSFFLSERQPLPARKPGSPNLKAPGPGPLGRGGRKTREQTMRDGEATRKNGGGGKNKSAAQGGRMMRERGEEKGGRDFSCEEEKKDAGKRSAVRREGGGRPRFELGNEGFADLCLTTWPRHQISL